MPDTFHKNLDPEFVHCLIASEEKRGNKISQEIKDFYGYKDNKDNDCDGKSNKGESSSLVGNDGNNSR